MNFYEILGVSRDASQDDIKSAYRKLAMKYHPDRHHNNEEASEDKFKEVSEAYSILSDPEKRSQYDRFGTVGSQPSVNISDIFDSAFFGDSGFFSSFFGSNRKRKGEDVIVNVTLSLEEVAKGIEKQVKYTRHNTCTSCRGLGGIGEKCKQCNGAGHVKTQQGFWMASYTCPDCHGQKIKIVKMCKECHGKGKIDETNTLSVKIPPGIGDQESLRYPGFGSVDDPAMPRGDLYCRIKVKAHKKFARDGMHLGYVHKINFVDATLGKDIDIPTIYGETIQLKIPPGVQYGQVFRVQEKGLPGLHRNKTVGDMLVKIEIVTPTKLSEKEKSLLEELGSILKCA